MNRILRITAAALVTYLLSFGLAASVTGTEPRSVELAAAGTVREAERAAEAEQAYIVKESGGVVAVFVKGGGLAAETDISVSGLRQKDRQLVAEGIEAESYDEVLCLLEDLGS